MASAIDRGISNQIQSEIRNVSGNRSANEYMAVFLVGVVMDDKDDLKMGRVWVYFPGYAAKGPDETVFPTWKGTAPDRRGDTDSQFDGSLRKNWTLCFPISGYFGSDEMRADYCADGRNSYGGNVNSYGDWYQPRIGDQVSCLLMNGDPSKAYWTGCLPKFNQMSMVPGMAGIPKAEVTPGPITEATAADAKLHGYDSTAKPALPNDGYSDENVEAVSPKSQVQAGSVNTAPSTSGGVFGSTSSGPSNPTGTPSNSPTQLTFGNPSKSVVLGGVAYDPHRGPGSSSSQRESPSYVTGRKSPGWVFDTEQFNSNAMGTGRFVDQTEKYRHVSTPGHQWVMDDHPDSQMIRFRSSGGSQFMMCDTGKVPYVFISTSKGNVWLELADDGNIHIYAEESISLHSKKDVNITADRAINLESQQMNTFVHDTYRETVGADKMVSINGGMSEMILGGLNTYVQAGASTTVQGPFGLTVTGDIAVRGASWSDCITGNHISDANGDRYQMSGGLHSLQASSIWINSGKTAEHKEPAKTTLPKFPELIKKPGVPTNQEIIRNERAEKDKYLGSKVPQHQPWPGRTGNDTSQTNGQVGPTQTATGTTTPPASGVIGRVDPAGAETNVRAGATSTTATTPDRIVGATSILHPPSGNSPNWTGMTYTETLNYLGAV